MSTFDKLIEQRKQQKIKQKEIADYLKCDKSTVSGYESKRRKISAEDQDKYAEKLGLKLIIENNICFNCGHKPIYNQKTGLCTDCFSNWVNFKLK